jgi:hypothetical protein
VIESSWSRPQRRRQALNGKQDDGGELRVVHRLGAEHGSQGGVGHEQTHRNCCQQLTRRQKVCGENRVQMSETWSHNGAVLHGSRNFGRVQRLGWKTTVQMPETRVLGRQDNLLQSRQAVVWRQSVIRQLGVQKLHLGRNFCAVRAQLGLVCCLTKTRAMLTFGKQIAMASKTHQCRHCDLNISFQKRHGGGCRLHTLADIVTSIKDTTLRGAEIGVQGKTGLRKSVVDSCQPLPLFKNLRPK